MTSTDGYTEQKHEEIMDDASLWEFPAPPP